MRITQIHRHVYVQNVGFGMLNNNPPPCTQKRKQQDTFWQKDKGIIRNKETKMLTIIVFGLNYCFLLSFLSITSNLLNLFYNIAPE